MAPGEGVDEGGDVVVAAQGEAGELQARGPALGAGVERRHLVGGELESCHLVEEQAGLGWREPQVGGAQLQQLASRPQPRQRQRRVGPGRHRDARPRREVLQEERDGVVHGGFGDDVVVVERQHRGPVELVEVVDQAGQHRLGRELAAGLEQGRGLGPGAHRGDQMRQEPTGVVVALVQRQPGNPRRRLVPGCQPLGEQRRLAESRRCRDEHQARGHRPGRGEPAGQPGSAYQVGARRGDVQLRAQHHHDPSLGASCPVSGNSGPECPGRPRRE